MDDRRFDRFAARLGDRVSRRTGIGAALATTVAAFLPAMAADAKQKCKGRKQKCGKQCVDVKRDRTNCGSCNRSCDANQICRSGTCVTCPSGLSGCGQSCVDKATNRANCGRCGNRCPARTVCQNGDCALCNSGLTACGNACVNLATDPNNCGQCGRACASGGCNNGACTCRGDMPNLCPSGCSCIASAQGGGACGRFQQTGESCTDDYLCRRGDICLAGISGTCYVGCPN